MGRARFLPAAVLASVNEVGRSWKNLDQVPLEAAPRSKAGRASPVLRARFQVFPRAAGIAAALPERAVLPLLLQSQAPLSRRNPSPALGPAECDPRNRTQHHDAN